MLEMPKIHRWGGYDDGHLEEAVELIDALNPPIQTLQTEDLPIRVDVDGCLPRRSYPDDAGLDLVCSEDTEVPLGEFRDIPCGISVELPHWSWALVTGRSSAFRKRGLLVLPGVIDAGYRGPIFAGAWAQRETVMVRKGERIAQMIVHQNSTRRLTPLAVGDLAPSARGTDGFGSTGA